MKLNLNNLEEPAPFPPLPGGRYRLKILDAELSVTKNGDPMWKLQFEVIEGDHSGARIFDNLVFSERGLIRVKRFCRSIGLDVSGEIELEPEDVKNKTCNAEVRVSTYTNSSGETKRTSSIPFDGYVPPESQHVAGTVVPF